METLKKVKLSELKMGPIGQEVLPAGFIDRVIKYKEILKEVETSTLEDTVSNFQRDLDPEKELVVWEKIAFTYKDFVGQYPDYTLEQKMEVFHTVLSHSLGMKK